MPRGGGRVPEQHPAHAHTMRGGQGGWDPHPRGPRRPGREAGGHGEGHGRHQRRHDRGAEELGGHGQVLRPLRPLLQQGLLQQGGRGRVEGRRRRLQGGVQPTTARHGPQLHGPADRIHRQDHERRPREGDGREHGAGGGHGGQHAKHGAGHRQLAAEPGGAAQQDHAQGGSQREERGRGRGEGARTHEGLNPVAHRPSPAAPRPRASASARSPRVSPQRHAQPASLQRFRNSHLRRNEPRPACEAVPLHLSLPRGLTLQEDLKIKRLQLLKFAESGRLDLQKGDSLISLRYYFLPSTILFLVRTVPSVPS